MTPQGWRLFVALTPPQPVVDDLARAVEPYRDIDSAWRWTQPQLWHVTLAFYGDVIENRVAEVCERLGRTASRHDGLELRFGGAGVFGSSIGAFVVWVAVEADRTAIRNLADSCVAVGRRVGLSMGERPYRPHLTLARSKAREGADARALVDALQRYEGPRWTASELHLLRSHLGAHPHYDTVASWPLRSMIHDVG